MVSKYSTRPAGRSVGCRYRLQRQLEARLGHRQLPERGLHRTAQALYRIVDFYERCERPDEARRWLARITPESRKHRIVQSTIGSWLDER